MKTSIYRVDPFKFAVSLCTCAVSLVVALCLLLALSRPGSAAVFLAIALLFLLVAATYGARIRVSDEGVERVSLLGRVTKRLAWADIHEIGVAGTSVFRKDDRKHPGTLYIYFSERKLTEPERFDLMLKFPPRSMLYCTYSRQRMEAIQLRYSGKIETFHAGDVTFS